MPDVIDYTELLGSPQQTEPDYTSMLGGRALPKKAKEMTKEEAMGQFAAPFIGAGTGVADVGNVLLNTLPNTEWNTARKNSMADFIKERSSDPENGSMFNAGRLVGNVAATWPVGGAAGSVLKRAAALPSLARAAPYIKPVANVMESGSTGIENTKGIFKNLAARVAGNALTGGLSTAAVSPENAVLGAAIGGFLPMATESTRGGIWLGNKMFGSGTAEAQALAKAAMGGNEFINPTLNKIQANMQGSTPGFNPTVMQASNNPSLRNQGNSIIRGNPELSNRLANITQSQNQAIMRESADLSGAGGAREAAKELRSNITAPMYENAYRTGFDPNMMTDAAKKQMQELNSRVINSISKETKNSAQLRGIPITEEKYLSTKNPLIIQARKEALPENSFMNSLQGMSLQKQNIGKEIGAETDPTRIMELSQLKNDFSNFLNSGVSPKYTAAENRFSNLSQPINQYDTLAEIFKGADPLQQRILPDAFLRKYSNPETAAKATGLQGATLENTLTQNNALPRLEGISKDLRMQDFGSRSSEGAAAQGVGSDLASDVISTAHPIHGATWRALKYALGGANHRAEIKLGEAMLNPDSFMKLYNNTQPAMRQQLVDSVLRNINNEATAQIPGLLNFGEYDKNGGQ